MPLLPTSVPSTKHPITSPVQSKNPFSPAPQSVSPTSCSGLPRVTSSEALENLSSDWNESLSNDLKM